MWTKVFIMAFLLSGSLSFWMLYKEDKTTLSVWEENITIWSGGICFLALIAGFLSALAGL